MASAAWATDVATPTPTAVINAGVRTQPECANREPNPISTTKNRAPPTPVKINVLTEFLIHCDESDRQYLIDGFTNGFRINFKGPAFSQITNNHASVYTYYDVVDRMVSRELELGRVAGPFDAPPFAYFVVSPLGVVPKKEAGKFRLIHDLSFPKQNSVNAFIDQQEASVQYETLDHLITLLQRIGRGALMAKTDIEDAFRLIPVHKDDHHLLGFQFNNKFYYDKCLPMGCRMSCNIFERFSSALQRIMQAAFNCKGVTHILDDFIFVGPPQCDTTLNYLNSFLRLAERCHIPIKQSKTVYPSTVIVAHGIELDSTAMQARLPVDKLERMRELLQKFKNKRHALLRDIQSLVGLLNFACKVIRPGRAFLRRLIDLTTKAHSKHHHIKLNSDARADIDAWLTFLHDFNGVSLFLHDQFVSSDAIKLYSDASGAKGYAAVFGSRWLAGPWTLAFEGLHITIKELFPIVLALEVWGHQLRNHKILFKSDNQAVVEIINKQTSRDRSVMILVRRLVLAALRNNVLFRATHIPGYTNTIPDRLSRFQFQEAQQLAPWLDPQPTSVPGHLLFLRSKRHPPAC